MDWVEYGGFTAISNIDSVRIDSIVINPPDPPNNQVEHVAEQTKRNIYLSTGNSNGEETYLRIYPNPVLDFLSIEFGDDKSIHALDIIDAQGSLQKQFFVDQARNEINLNDLEEGLYFLRFRSMDNRISYKKIIKAN